MPTIVLSVEWRGSNLSSREKYDVNEFWKFDMRVGKVLEAERVPGTRKLIKMKVDFGDSTKTAVTGIADQIDLMLLRGKKFIFVINLKERGIRGIISEVMLLVAEEESGKIHLIPVSDEVPVGTRVW